MNGKILLSHPTGNSFVRSAAHAFHSVGWLQELSSCICWDQQSYFSRALPRQMTSQLARRSFNDVPLYMQHSYPWREFFRLVTAGFPLPWLTRHEHGPLCVDAVYRSFDLHVAARLASLADLQAVYAYEDGALHTFKAARDLGLTCIYDLPIGYWRAGRIIFEEEKELRPEWACTLTGLNDSLAKLTRKDHELELANLIVVPSEFVRSTLVAHRVCEAPIVVIPFGSPVPRSRLPVTNTSSPLRVLYVGSLGQRKGLSYALDAVESLGDKVTLTLIGRITSTECKPLQSALERHRWIQSLTHSEILVQMAQHDVLLFPTLFDGFGLVITEALSQGLPVITTLHSGAPECVRDGIEGFIVPIRDPCAIAQRLEQLLNNPDQLTSMREACLHRSAELSWASYEYNLCNAVGLALRR